MNEKRKISIRKIDENNNQDVLNLKIKPEQQDYIESVADCLKEAHELSLWRPVGLYDQNQLIGFAMYGLWHEKNQKRVWLDRFLIDKQYQGKGYGKQFLDVLLTHIFDEYGCHEIYLSLYDDNDHALKLYQQIGFVMNGEKDIHGETVMVKKRISLKD